VSVVAAFDPVCLLSVLSDHDVDFVLVGGMAAVLHGSPTVTTDADIVPARTPGNLSRLAGALRDLNARIGSATEVDGIAFEPHPDLLASMSMLNLTTRCGDLDLTFTPAGIGTYEDIRPTAVSFDIDGFIVQVASLDDVIRSKRSADRPKDRAVLPILEALREELDRE
jgi:hypothetical protein